MNLTHYAAEPVTLDRTRVYAQSKEIWTYEKPVGLWVSADGEQDWPAWCHGEEFSLGSLAIPHRVTLAANANILTITNLLEIDEFTVEHAKPTTHDPHTKWVCDSLFWGVDWRQVADQFDGIVIAPYQLARRYKLSWYYGWDCASGCIWNLDAVADFSAIEQAVS